MMQRSDKKANPPSIKTMIQKATTLLPGHKRPDTLDTYMPFVPYRGNGLVLASYRLMVLYHQLKDYQDRATSIRKAGLDKLDASIQHSLLQLENCQEVLYDRHTWKTIGECGIADQLQLLRNYRTTLPSNAIQTKRYKDRYDSYRETFLSFIGLCVDATSSHQASLLQTGDAESVQTVRFRLVCSDLLYQLSKAWDVFEDPEAHVHPFTIGTVLTKTMDGSQSGFWVHLPMNVSLLDFQMVLRSMYPKINTTSIAATNWELVLSNGNDIHIGIRRENSLSGDHVRWNFAIAMEEMK